MRTKEKARRSPGSKRRAIGLIQGEVADVDKILRQNGDHGRHRVASSLGAYNLRRAVRLGDEGNFFERRDLQNIVKATSAETMGYLGVSLFSYHETRVLLRAVGGATFRLKDALEGAAERMPSELEGHLGKATVLGRTDDGPGNRYVAVGFFDPLRTQIQSERIGIASGLGVNLRPQISHVSVLRTKDRQLAEDVKDQINEQVAPRGNSIVLEELKPHPVRLHSP